jgi:VIT1/CCC1 family predicted Fe2+/Mn2+ transporter
MVLTGLGWKVMSELRKIQRGSAVGRGLNRVIGFGVRRGLRSVEVNPEDFRRQLADKHGLWIPNFGRMQDVPLERLDAIAKKLIRDAELLALAEGAGFGLGGMITLLPDASILTAITLRLIQRLCLLYGFETRGHDERVELWMAAATATGVDYGKDLVEKQMFEKLAPRIARRLAVKIGEETAEKWVGRLIPVASSAIGGILNFSFVRAWGRRAQRNLREKHVAARVVDASTAGTFTASDPNLN